MTARPPAGLSPFPHRTIWLLAVAFAVAVAALIGAAAIPLLGGSHCPTAVVIGDALRLAGCAQ